MVVTSEECAYFIPKVKVLMFADTDDPYHSEAFNFSLSLIPGYETTHEHSYQLSLNQQDEVWKALSKCNNDTYICSSFSSKTRYPV